MQADIFNAEIVALTAEQGPGLGAAMLAALGCGWFSDIESCAATFVEYTEAIQPIPENVAIYTKVYEEYRRIYPNVRKIK